MSFPTPATDVSTATETTETVETAVFTERVEDYEDYWNVVDTYRFLGKLARSVLFTADERADGVSNAKIEAKADVSPIAEHFVFYKETKDGMKADFNSLRESGDLDKQASLPKYKETFEAPEADCESVTEDNFEDFSVAADQWNADRDETIFLPADYEPVVDDDGNLVVYYETEDGNADLGAILAIAADTDGIGDKTLAKLEANLQNAGF